MVQSWRDMSRLLTICRQTNIKDSIQRQPFVCSCHYEPVQRHSKQTENTNSALRFFLTAQQQKIFFSFPLSQTGLQHDGTAGNISINRLLVVVDVRSEIPLQMAVMFEGVQFVVMVNAAADHQ